MKIFFLLLGVVLGYRRTIVIPDIHGDSTALLQSLYAGYKDVVQVSPVSYSNFVTRFSRVINQRQPPLFPLYSRRDVAVVQLGDLIDRGERSLECLIIMKAVRMVTGFDVHQVMGNHELAAAVSPAYYNRTIHPNDDMNRTPHAQRTLWQHVIGSRNFKPMLKIDDTLFVHAGLRMNQFITDQVFPLLMNLTNGNDRVTLLNHFILADIAAGPASRTEHEYLRSASIFTSRDFESPDLDCESLSSVLEVAQVSRVVVGHMASDTLRVRENCDGQIILADFAMSKYMVSADPVSRPGALIIDTTTTETAQLYALYYDVEHETSFDESSPFSEIDPVGIRTNRILVGSVSAGPVVPSGPYLHLTLKNPGDQERHDGVLIRACEIGQEDGFLIEFHPSDATKFALRILDYKLAQLEASGSDLPIPLLFNVVSTRILDVDVSAEDEEVLNGPAVFVQSRAQAILDRSMYYSDLSIHMRYVVSFLHQLGLCLGFVHRISLQYNTDRFLEKFALNMDSSDLDLIDITGISKCPQHELLLEAQTLRDIIRLLGTANDYSEDDERA